MHTLKGILPFGAEPELLHNDRISIVSAVLWISLWGFVLQILLTIMCTILAAKSILNYSLL